MIRSTHTMALLELSAAAYAEIRKKLELAGYQEQINERDGVIDMNGIGVTREEKVDGQSQTD